MKKKWMIPVIIICSLGILYFAAQFTGLLRAFNIPTEANEPNIKHGSWVYASRLVTPKRFDFISFRQEAGQYWPEGTWLMRLCGLPGDKIQIINGTLFVNNRNADAGLNLKEQYMVSKVELKKLSENFVKDQENVRLLDNDSANLMLPSAEFREKAMIGRMVVETGNDADSRYTGFIPQSHFRGTVFSVH